MVLTTHHMDEAETCQRVAIMDHGQDPADRGARRPGPQPGAPGPISVTSGTLGQDEARAIANGAQVADDGVSLTITTTEPAPILARLAERDALAGLQVTGASLEDVFLQLTGREYRA